MSLAPKIRKRSSDKNSNVTDTGNLSIYFSCDIIAVISPLVGSGGCAFFLRVQQQQRGGPRAALFVCVARKYAMFICQLSVAQFGTH